MSKTMRFWLWLSVLLAVSGALMLYPIGTPALNAVFVAVKIGMVGGLLILLLSGSRKGFWLWAVCSGLAVVMTVCKWMGGGTQIPLYLLSMLVDILMPTGAWKLSKSR